MEHNNKKYDFCGEISEILPNTPNKVAPKKGHFCMKNGDISPIYEHNALKNTLGLATFGGGLLENKHVPL